MENGLLTVRMLGDFSLEWNGASINDGDNRSKKVWLLLAYMIYNRRHTVTQEELIELLWGEETGSSNPINALKTMFHRVRTMLDGLGPFAGHTLILRREGAYLWNNDVELTLDVERFVELRDRAAAMTDVDEQVQTYLDALALYRGDFLSRLNVEPWVVPISAFYHNLYLQTVSEVMPLLDQNSLYAEAAELGRQAIVIDPYSEEHYQHLMRALSALGDLQGVVDVYQEMEELLFSNFGVMPSDETKAIYREATRTVNDRAVSPDLMRQQLKEPDNGRGALFCEYDFFKVLYHAEARAIVRSGDAVHIGLLSVSGEKGATLSKRSLDVCMENLQALLCANLRKGDVASRCSVSQFVVMLPQANYENACMVMERVIRAFFRQYPHSPAELHATVQPLEPNA